MTLNAEKCVAASSTFLAIVTSSYTVQFTDTFSQLELSQYHDRLHEIFESLLNTVTEGIPVNDQVRFVLQSPLLEYPISLPFMSRQRLTTERVLAEIERVIQSNHEFRLNDSVNVNLIHVEMLHGGTGTKRSQINLEKHLVNKRSIVRIHNTDKLCLARALVVSIAKIENDKKYRSIADSQWPMQTHLAKELHEKAEVPLGACGLNEVKQFQTYLSDYQINIVSKEHQNSILYSGPENEKRIYLYLHDSHFDVITSMPAFLLVKDIVTPVKNPMTIGEIIFVPMHVNYAIILIVPLFPGFTARPAIDILKVKSASIDINNQ